MYITITPFSFLIGATSKEHKKAVPVVDEKKA